MFGRNSSRECSRLRRDWSRLHFGRPANPLGPRRGYEHASRSRLVVPASVLAGASRIGKDRRLLFYSTSRIITASSAQTKFGGHLRGPHRPPRTSHSPPTFAWAASCAC